LAISRRNLMLDGPLTRACCALYATRHLGCGPVAHADPRL